MFSILILLIFLPSLTSAALSSSGCTCTDTCDYHEYSFTWCHVSSGCSGAGYNWFDGYWDYCIVSSTSNSTSNVTVSTFAGSGIGGSADGQGTLATFKLPYGVAVDSSGNLYVSDYNNNKIRKITASGLVSTFAGSGTGGSADGQGTSASFYGPRGITLDSSGNLYVADYSNNKIRKITASGYVSSFAGSGTFGSADGQGTSASFYGPSGIALDSSGNLYVTDESNKKIHKITASGYVSTFAGSGASGGANGQGTAASFSYPNGIAVDSSGNVYVGERYKIRKITASGLVSTFAGNGTFGSADGQGTLATFNIADGIAVDSSGNVYVADRNNNKIRKITASGLVSTFAGNGTAGSADGLGTLATFNGPEGISIDSSGNIYVADTNNNKIRKIVVSSSSVSSISTSISFSGCNCTNICDYHEYTYAWCHVSSSCSGAGYNWFSGYWDYCSLNGTLVSGNSGTIVRLRNVTVSTLSGSGTNGSTDGQGTLATFNFPAAITIDSDRNLYVTDALNNKIRKITSNGVVSTLSGSGAQGSTDGGGTLASFKGPQGITERYSDIYVVDTANNKIRKIASNGVVSTFAGNGTSGKADGQGTLATFNGPMGIAVDSSGNFYVADTFNNKIRKITASGLVSTFAGNGTAGSTDGQGTIALFNGPQGIAVDSLDNVLVADTKNHKIRKISPTGYVSTLAGNASFGYNDGQLLTATFKFPSAVALDSLGSIYVADYGNYKIRKITSSGYVFTLAGNGTFGSADGSGESSMFKGPVSIIVDPSGDLFVADAFNNKIRKISQPSETTSSVANIATVTSESSRTSIQSSETAFSVANSATTASDPVSASSQPSDATSSITNSATTASDPVSAPSQPSDASSPITNSATSASDPISTSIQPSETSSSITNSATTASASSGLWTTYGSGIIGSADGQGTLATFKGPHGVSVDSFGNIYVSDTYNNKIRKITTSGYVSTFAGSGSIGSVDGQGTAASFYYPYGIAVDSSGNIYVADTYNNKIRKIAATGLVSTFAGSGSSGSADGQGTLATFNGPMGISVDSSDNLYVADTYSNKIRKITSNGYVSTLSGSGTFGSTDGQGTLASFYYPFGVSVDSSGNCYVADTNNNKIRKITSNGYVSTIAGSGSSGSADGQGSLASFYYPYGASVDSSGNIYVSDTYNNKIRKITASGLVSTFAGSGSSDGQSTLNTFGGPYGIAVDSSGNLCVADSWNHKIRKIALSSSTSSNNSTTSNSTSTTSTSNSTSTLSKSSSNSATSSSLLVVSTFCMYVIWL